MNKKWFFSLVLFGLSNVAISANLVDVYQQSLISDPIYQQAVATRLATVEGVPISRAALFPTVLFTATPSITKSHNTGILARGFVPAADNVHQYVLNMSVTQTIFNFAQFATLSGAKATAKQADATLNAALQNLMLRVAAAYFAVLQDEDNLAFNKANKAAFAKQLDQINEQYKVGLKTITDVYTAQASYDSSSASYIAADTQLSNDRENLRAITGIYYPDLAKLSEDFPLISPQPKDMEAWVNTAVKQNWSIRASQYGATAAMEVIKQQFAGHLPTLNAQGTYNVDYTRGIARSLSSPAGPSKQRDATFSLNFALPIFEGGLVVAQTSQARYNYLLAIEQLEQTLRSTVNTTRQSYMGIIAGIQQIQADKETIKSSMSSLRGLREGYQVGTQTLVDVLNQQQNVFKAFQQYAADRYTYVNNLLILKNAAGTLSQEDLCAVNAWLVNESVEQSNAAYRELVEENPSTNKPGTIMNSQNKHAHPTLAAKASPKVSDHTLGHAKLSPQHVVSAKKTSTSHDQILGKISV